MPIGSRVLDERTVAALRRPLPMMARVTMAHVPARVSLKTPDGATLVTVGKGRAVDITADPPELLLFCFGRNAVRATFTGDDNAIAAVKAAKRGL